MKQSGWLLLGAHILFWMGIVTGWMDGGRDVMIQCSVGATFFVGLAIYQQNKERGQ